MIKSILDLLNEEDGLVKELNRIKDPKEYTEKLEAIKYTRECIRQKVTTNAEVNHLKYLNKRVNKAPTPQQGNVSLISTKKRRLFISQPFTGKDDSEIMVQRANLFKLFALFKGHDANDVDLIENHLPDDDYDKLENFETLDQWNAYRLCRSVGMLGKATDIIFYGDWENSRGANIERDICEKYNLDFIDNKDLIEFCKNSDNTEVLDLFKKLYPKEFVQYYDSLKCPNTNGECE